MDFAGLLIFTLINNSIENSDTLDQGFDLKLGCAHFDLIQGIGKLGDFICD